MASLQTKGKKYYVVLYVDKKQKWIPLGIDVKKGNKKIAEQAMAEMIVKYSNNPNTINNVMLSDYIRSWLENVKNHVDIITYEDYKQYANNHIIPYFEKKKIKLANVTFQDIENYYNYKFTSGRLDGKPGGLALSTIRRHKVVLNLTFKKAICEGIININPCEYARLPKETNHNTVAKFYTVEQCKKLLEVTKGSVLHDMIYLTIIYGLRRSELMGLKWNAVDFVNNTITIKHTVVLQNQIVAKDKTKNKSSNRVYPLLDDVKEILLKIKDNQQKDKEFFGKSYKNNDYIFKDVRGNQYYPSYPTHSLRKILKKNELPHIRWHDLRHSCASMLILKSWQMKEISDWLGHADIGTTMNIYGHLDIGHKRDLGNSLNGMFN